MRARWSSSIRRAAAAAGVLLAVAGCSDDSGFADVDRAAIEGVLVAADPALADDDDARESAVDAVEQLCEDLAGGNVAQIAYLEADDLTKDAARAGCPDRLAVTVDS